MAIINIWRSSILIFVLVRSGRRVGRCIVRHNTWATLAVQRRFSESPRLCDIFDNAAATAAAGREIGQIRFLGSPLLLCSYPKCLFIVDFASSKGEQNWKWQIFYSNKFFLLVKNRCVWEICVGVVLRGNNANGKRMGTHDDESVARITAKHQTGFLSVSQSEWHAVV